MPLRIEVSFKISRDRLAALHEVYDHTIEGYSPEDSLQYLLLSQAKDMQFKLHAMVHKRHVTATLSMSEPEAIAFCLWWNGWAITHPLARITILQIIAVIDKKTKAHAY